MNTAEFNLADAVGELVTMLDSREPTPQQIAMYCKSLAEYPPDHVRDAFRETLEEDDRFIFSRIMNRVHEKDGRPTAEAMWVELCVDESKTIWRTDEANEAMPQTRSMALSVAIDENDKQQIAQIRSAFKHDYDAAVKSARRKGRSIAWHESIGFDKHHRESKMQEAIALGRVGVNRAQELLPGMDFPELPPTDSKIGAVIQATAKAMES